MNTSPILDSLNEQQRDAVTSGVGSLLVLAGAGSGKTRVLVHRIAWLLQEQGVPPSAILAVTFTNRAAREMRNRIEELLGGPPEGMWVGTFHGLAARLLRIHWREAGLHENFEIIDADDQLQVISRIVQRMGIDPELWRPRGFQSYINERKDEGRRSHHIQDNREDNEKTALSLQVYQEYEKECEDRADGDGADRERRVLQVDFAELLLRSQELLRDNSRILEQYQRRFQHVLVDEFQDTNTMQYAWLRVLTGAGTPLMAVGDDDQSIYRWRGARVENIQSFNADFKGSDIIRLEQNYRSTSNILAAANALIAHNEGRLGKNLWTDDGAGEKIALYEATDEGHEARFVAQCLSEWSASGKPLSEAAVLYRSHAQSRELEAALLQADVPYRIFGGQRFYQRLEIKNALAYLRLLLNRHDDNSCERVINVPGRGIGKQTVEALRAIVRQQDCSLWQACVHCVNDPTLLASRRASSVLAFLKLLDNLEAACKGLPLPQKVERVITDAGLIEWHGREEGETGRNRVENLQELVTAASKFDEPTLTTERGKPVDDSSDEYLRTFLEVVCLDASGLTGDDGLDAAQLMTFHSAKGLEFDLVLMVGMEENLFPHKFSVEDPAALEEERRLCYVGITRARKKLYLTHAQTRMVFSNSWNPDSPERRPSRFVYEIPKQLIDDLSFTFQVRRGRYNFTRKTDSSATIDACESATALSSGQVVSHGKFGKGVVLNSQGSGPNTRVQVRFEQVGIKWLVLSYAKLQVRGR